MPSKFDIKNYFENKQLKTWFSTVHSNDVCNFYIFAECFLRIFNFLTHFKINFRRHSWICFNKSDMFSLIKCLAESVEINSILTKKKKPYTLNIEWGKIHQTYSRPVCVWDSFFTFDAILNHFDGGLVIQQVKQCKFSRNFFSAKSTKSILFLCKLEILLRHARWEKTRMKADWLDFKTTYIQQFCKLHF